MNATLLFSGGLDSILAARIFKKAGGNNLFLINFYTPFFSIKESILGYKETSFKPLFIKNITKKQLNLLDNSKKDFGKALNPCIKCHNQMFSSIPQNIVEKVNFFISGEVLDERPKSQNKTALKKVEINIIKPIIRVLSAKLLYEEEFVKKFFKHPQNLEAIKGRNRSRQLELAKEFNLKFIPSPAGGCKLTDISYANKLALLVIFYGKFANIPEEILYLANHTRIIGNKNFLLFSPKNLEDINIINNFSKFGKIIHIENKTALFIGNFFYLKQAIFLLKNKKTATFFTPNSRLYKFLKF